MVKWDWGGIREKRGIGEESHRTKREIREEHRKTGIGVGTEREETLLLTPSTLSQSSTLADGRGTVTSTPQRPRPPHLGTGEIAGNRTGENEGRMIERETEIQTEESNNSWQVRNH